jgi:hypothetical protein
VCVAQGGIGDLRAIFETTFKPVFVNTAKITFLQVFMMDEWLKSCAPDTELLIVDCIKEHMVVFVKIEEDIMPQYAGLIPSIIWFGVYKEDIKKLNIKMSVSWDVIQHILLLLPDPHTYYNIARQLCKNSRTKWMPHVVNWYYIVQYITAEKQVQTVSVVWNNIAHKHMKKKGKKYVHNMETYIGTNSVIYWYSKPEYISYLGRDTVIFTKSRLYTGYYYGLNDVSENLVNRFVQTEIGKHKRVYWKKLHDDGMYELGFKKQKYNFKVLKGTTLWVF